MSIRQHPDPVLRRVCAPVERFDDDLAELVRDLRRALELSERAGRPGIGLSAPQIGVPVRVFVAEGWPDPFVNPVVIGHSHQFGVGHESCLSLVWGRVYAVERWKTCETVAADLDGVERRRKHRSIDARVVQHELDHLDGILLPDRVAVGVRGAA